MSETQHTCVVRVNLFLFVEATGQYQEHGSVGCAIIGTVTQPPVYKMGCYNDKNEYLCTVSITTNNEAGAYIVLHEGGYVSFKDELARNWSMQFETEDKAIEFCAHVAVSMYGVAGQPEQGILACDVSSGNRDRVIFANNTIKVRFQSWVIQSVDHGKGLPSLGSRLDGNLKDQKPYTMDVPANHMSVLSSMKGFEGMVIGMSEGGSRLVVVPLKAKRGGGPQVHMCFYIHVIRKKDSSSSGTNEQASIGLLANSTVVDDHRDSKAVIVEGNHDYLRRPQSPPPGFSGEQLLVVDRLRDQVHVLSQQLKEARRQLDTFRNEVKLYEKKVKPQSLASAQIEFSVQKLIQDTDDAKDLLEQKNTTLRQQEDKNRDLQKKFEKFSTAANVLAEEKKDTITNSNEEKLDMDRRIARAQSELTRLQGEREDVSRHLSTVKGLLQVTDQELKKEKNELQVSTISFQTNESKLAATEESHAEEMARRKILESKVVLLGTQLRGILEDVRTKESQIDERRKKMETDKLHYTQLLEDERSKASADVRELRQELIDEVALRDRRYQDERHRIAHENYDRGHIQGIEDGENEVLLEADALTQNLTLDIQRQEAEMHAMSIRLKSAKEQNEVDERRLNAQIEALQNAISSLESHNAQLETELDTLTSAKETVEDDIFSKIAAALDQLSQPIGRGDLLTLIHCVRVKKNIDYGFEVKRLEEQRQRLEEERRDVFEWVREAVNGPARFPPMRTLHAPELPFHYSSSTALVDESPLDPESIDRRVADEMQYQEECVKFDPDEMNRRYDELLKELIDKNPNTGIMPLENSGNVDTSTILKKLDDVDANTVMTSTSPFETEKDEGHLQGLDEQGAIHAFEFHPPTEEMPAESKESLENEVKVCATLESVNEDIDHVKDVVEDPVNDSSNVDKGHDSHIPQSLSSGVPPKRKKFSFSDSDTDSDYEPAWKTKTVQEQRVKSVPKKSLFDDSDDSSDGVIA